MMELVLLSAGAIAGFMLTKITSPAEEPEAIDEHEITLQYLHGWDGYYAEMIPLYEADPNPDPECMFDELNFYSIREAHKYHRQLKAVITQLETYTS